MNRKLTTLLLVLLLLVLAAFAAANRATRAQNEPFAPQTTPPACETAMAVVDAPPALLHALESNRLARCSW